MAGYRAMQHPNAPAPEPVFMKGRYAIRKDGAVFTNTPTLNSRKDFEFSDELPDWHIDSIKQARIREEAQKVAHEEYLARTEERIALREQKTKELFKKAQEKVVSQASDPESQANAAKFVIANAKTVAELAEFVQTTYDVKLDRRKSLNTLQHEAAALIKAE